MFVHAYDDGGGNLRKPEIPTFSLLGHVFKRRVWMFRVLLVLVVFDVSNVALDMLSRFFSIEKSRSFFESPVLRLDEEEVQEDELEREPAAVDNLSTKW